MGDHDLWAWPDDIRDLAGQCGHLLHSGSDPYLCAAGIGTRTHPEPQPSAANASHQSFASSSSGVLSVRPRSLLLLLGAVPALHRPLSWGGVWIFAVTLLFDAPVRGMHESPPQLAAEDEAIVPVLNTTRTCTVAWGHELSCQTNSFEVAAEDVLDYIRLVSPDPLVRVQLWSPYNGPSTLEFHRDDTFARFHQLLVVAGHAPTHRLAVAYDTIGTILDLLTIPVGPVTWWIVRDGLNRELLRPVTLWAEPGARYVLTLNSHGQAQALSCAPEVARLHRLPQGVRATITLPFTRTVGQMTPSGLVLYEVAVGALASASAFRLGWVPLVFSTVLFSQTAVAMQAPTGCPAPHDLAVPARQYRSTPEPVVTRIWTYTCDAPVETPFVAAPDLTRMHRQIEGTGRGIPPAGDFVWTSPRVVQGRAHILHFPPRTVPSYVYWLLHYRARGHVVAASDLEFDWALIGALAADAFGETWFSQGAFGIMQQGRVVQYGNAIGIPPHGAIIHLVRTSLQPRLGYTGWDAPADPGCIVPFDYDICLGARGGLPIVLDAHDCPRTARAASGSAVASAAASEPDSTQVARNLERQIAEVSNDLQVLVTRLETAGVLPAAEVAPWTTDVSSPAPEGTSADHSASRPPRSPVLQITLGWFVLASTDRSSRSAASILLASLVLGGQGALAQDHDGDTSSDEPAISEPSSPSQLESLQAPTPLTGLADAPGERPVVTPSSDPMSSTSVPEQDSLTAGAEAGAELRICDLQHRFSCAIRGLHLPVPAGVPYIPAGHPVIMHNPFTGRPQCRLRTTTQGTAQVLRNTLADYASRRGWQPVVDVQPQPDSQAVHLIPAASRPDLVPVLLSAEGELHPMCISRSFPGRGSRPYQFDGREGRVIAPYPTRRIEAGPVQLRDGECFPVNFGPFGPPPPQPVHDAADCLSCWGLLATVAFLPRWHGMLLAMFVLPQVIGGPTHDDRGGKPIYRISAFPWRTPASARTAQPVCNSLQCRFTMLCPWTGAHGVYTADSNGAGTGLTCQAGRDSSICQHGRASDMTA